MLSTSLPPRNEIPYQRLTILVALFCLVCLAATWHNIAHAGEDSGSTKQNSDASVNQSTELSNNEPIDLANALPLDAPMCYLKAHKSFEEVAAKSIISLPVKVTAYGSLGTSVALIAPTLGASFPLGLLASMGSLAAADLNKQTRLGDRERFMGIVLEAAAYGKKLQSGIKPSPRDYPLMRALEKRVNGFFNRSNNLEAIATTINQLEVDPDFCNDANNMRFVHLKDRVLEQLNIES